MKKIYTFIQVSQQVLNLSGYKVLRSLSLSGYKVLRSLSPSGYEEYSIGCLYTGSNFLKTSKPNNLKTYNLSKRKLTIFIASIIACALPAFAQTEVSHNLDLKLGYSIGGTMPHGMPESIRALNGYSLRPNIQIGADYERLLNQSWGISAGLHFENKGMKTDAKVKNYHMKMVQGEDVIEGMFTGNVVTESDMWQIAVPVQATYHPCSNLRLKAGPYLAIALSKKFGGYAYDGHLRKGDPTGPYVELGNTESERGNYDFDNELRSVNWGLSIGADYLISKNIGVYADFTWGLNGAFKSSFKTIEQTMYPIFGTIGVSYRLF